MPPKDPPVVVSDGSFNLAIDEPLDLAADPCDPKTHRPYVYTRRGDRNIRYLVVKVKDRTVFKWEFRPKECQIEIYWEKPKEHPPVKAKTAAKKTAKKSAK